MPGAKGPWGALAADGKGRWGYAIGYATEEFARAAAVKGCGGGTCKAALAAQMRCYAYYESRTRGYWYGMALDGSLQRAISTARGFCEKGAPAGTCKEMKAQCS